MSAFARGAQIVRKSVPTGRRVHSARTSESASREINDLHVLSGEQIWAADELPSLQHTSRTQILINFAARQTKDNPSATPLADGRISDPT